MELSWPLGISRLVPQDQRSLFGVLSHVINPLLTKLVRSRWLDIGVSRKLRSKTPSRSRKLRPKSPCKFQKLRPKIPSKSRKLRSFYLFIYLFIFIFFFYSTHTHTHTHTHTKQTTYLQDRHIYIFTVKQYTWLPILKRKSKH